MLEDSFLEPFSVAGLLLGDKGTPESSWEDLDLRADSKECLAEAGSLETSCSFPAAFVFDCCEAGG